MKTAIYSAPSEIVSDGKKIQFRMSSSPKAFAILADGIYSDKITAIIRELSTNASDSHIQAGNTNPFDVHLPTTFNQNFYIRDYGVGLTEEEIETIYTTFFESNKTDSNDFTGGLGLGSKTPFCYHTKSFIITSFKNGIKLIYSAYIDEHGYPSLVKMSEENSDEPSGLKVEFPVKTYDINDFFIKAGKVYKYFSIKPKMVGRAIAIENVKTDKFIEDKNQYINSIYHSDRSGIIMGNIFYPHDFFNYSNFLVYCDIGSLDIETNREGLAYTEKTNRRLEYIKKLISDKFAEVVEKEIASCDSMWLAQIALAKYLQKNSDFKLEELKWRGQTIKTSFQSDELSKCFSINYGYKDRNLDHIRLSASADNKSSLGFNGGVFLSNSSYAHKRVKDNANLHGRSLLIPNEAVLKEFLTLTNFPENEVRKTSDLPLNIKRGVSKTKGNKKTTLCKLQNTYGKVSAFVNIEIDLDTYDFSKSVYICSDRYDLLSKDKTITYSPKEIYRIEDLQNVVDLPTILTVTKSQEKEISKVCENYWDWLEKTMKLKAVEEAIVDYLTYKDSFSSYSEKGFAESLSKLKQANEKGHEIYEFVKAFKKTRSRNFSNILLFRNTLPKYNTYNSNTEYARLIKKYPLLDSIDNKQIVHAEKYIDLVNKGEF